MIEMHKLITNLWGKKDIMRIVMKSPLTMRKRLMFVLDRLGRQAHLDASPIKIKKIRLADGFTYVVRNKQL